MRWNRLAATAGIAYVLIAFVEFAGPGFPGTGDSAAALDAHFVEHRSWYLAAVVVQAVTNATWLVFLCGLVLLIRRAGSVAAASVAFTGGVLNVATAFTGLAFIASLAFGVAGSGDPALTKSFFTLATMTLVLSNVLLGLMATAVASAALPRWFRGTTALTAVVYFAGGGALARHGAFAPDGAVQFATYGLELLWTLAASIVLLRSRTGRPPPRTA